MEIIDMKTDLIQAYQEILSAKFPTIIICADPNIAQRNGGTLGAFCIPDDQASEYMDFMVNEFSDILEELGLQEVPLLPRSESTTREYYPDIWEKYLNGQACMELIIECVNEPETKSMHDIWVYEQWNKQIPVETIDPQNNYNTGLQVAA